MAGRRQNDNYYGRNNEPETHIYTDGSCSNNGRAGARGGVGVYVEGRPDLTVSEPFKYGRATNNRAELDGFIKGTDLAEKHNLPNPVIHTDSRYVHDSVNKWHGQWSQPDRNWTTTKGEPVKNFKQQYKAFKTCERVQPRVVHVRGHSRDPGNDYADQLAKDGRRKN